MSFGVRDAIETPVEGLPSDNEEREGEPRVLERLNEPDRALVGHALLLDGRLLTLLNARLGGAFDRRDRRSNGLASKCGATAEGGDLRVREVGERLDARHGGEHLAKNDEVLGVTSEELVRDVLQNRLGVDKGRVPAAHLASKGGKT